MDIGLIFTAVSVVKSATALRQSVAQLFGVINSLEAKVDRLISSELSSGLRNLEQACSSEGEEESLLREARNCFNRAIGLESGYRRGLAYLGLAVCHHHLEDDVNCRKALEDLLSLPPAVSDWAVLAAAFRRQLPGTPYGSRYESLMGMWSPLARRAYQQERIDYEKGIVMSAVNNSVEAKSLLELQEGVAQFIAKPVTWQADLEIGQFELPEEKRSS